MNIVFKIIYPNGKIYVGQDRTNSIGYFGSASNALVAADFTPEQRRSFTITRDVLWESEDASVQEVGAVEFRFIRELGANDPAIGYNTWPRLRPALSGQPMASTPERDPDFAEVPGGGEHQAKGNSD